jgi:hypothetical protein
VLSTYWFAHIPLGLARFQESGLIEADSNNLRSALENLQRMPDDARTQQAYLDSFPHTYKEFLQLFEPGKPLYDGYYDYINVLASLGKNHEREVGRLLLNLGKDAHKEADAPALLQHVTAV